MTNINKIFKCSEKSKFLTFIDNRNKNFYKLVNGKKYSIIDDAIIHEKCYKLSKCEKVVALIKCIACFPLLAVTIMLKLVNKENQNLAERFELLKINEFIKTDDFKYARRRSGSFSPPIAPVKMPSHTPSPSLSDKEPSKHSKDSYKRNAHSGELSDTDTSYPESQKSDSSTSSVKLHEPAVVIPLKEMLPVTQDVFDDTPFTNTGREDTSIEQPTSSEVLPEPQDTSLTLHHPETAIEIEAPISSVLNEDVLPEPQAISEDIPLTNPVREDASIEQPAPSILNEDELTETQNISNDIPLTEAKSQDDTSLLTNTPDYVPAEKLQDEIPFTQPTIPPHEESGAALIGEPSVQLQGISDFLDGMPLYEDSVLVNPAERSLIEEEKSSTFTAYLTNTVAPMAMEGLRQSTSWAFGQFVKGAFVYGASALTGIPPSEFELGISVQKMADKY